MRVAVLYNDACDDATAAERDVIVQRDAVSEALRTLGHDVHGIGCTLDLATTRTRLMACRPDVVFNLVESLGGTDRLMVLATLLLDSLEIPYTGCTTEVILRTNDKLAAKRWLVQGGLPTPAWLADDGTDDDGTDSGRRMIVKTVWEHASFGIDDTAVVTMGDVVELHERLRQRRADTGRAHFAETFIDGRELNLSLLGGPGEYRVLPPAEIDFSAFPPGKPRIVGYRAKWDGDSFESIHTPRCFDFPEADTPLVRQLTALAEQSCRWFGVQGYARVDFRVDPQGRAWILEINANPCLAPDAGFAAALEQAGISFVEAMEWILCEARSRCGWVASGHEDRVAS